MPNLAISLHATTDEQRGRSCRSIASTRSTRSSTPAGDFRSKRRRRITFEYVLLDGVNDTPEDARRLCAARAASRPRSTCCRSTKRRASRSAAADERVNAFAKILADRGIIVSVRKSRGRDIRAACGQLIVEGEKVSAGQRLGRALESR